jgi:hypothetical protein
MQHIHLSKLPPQHFLPIFIFYFPFFCLKKSPFASSVHSFFLWSVQYEPAFYPILWPICSRTTDPVLFIFSIEANLDQPTNTSCISSSQSMSTAALSLPPPAIPAKN